MPCYSVINEIDKACGTNGRTFKKWNANFQVSIKAGNFLTEKMLTSQDGPRNMKLGLLPNRGYIPTLRGGPEKTLEKLQPRYPDRDTNRHLSTALLALSMNVVSTTSI
jgi:hypothetical protein